MAFVMTYSEIERVLKLINTFLHNVTPRRLLELAENRKLVSLPPTTQYQTALAEPATPPAVDEASGYAKAEEGAGVPVVVSTSSERTAKLLAGTTHIAPPIAFHPSAPPDAIAATLTHRLEEWLSPSDETLTSEERAIRTHYYHFLLRDAALELLRKRKEEQAKHRPAKRRKTSSSPIDEISASDMRRAQTAIDNSIKQYIPCINWWTVAYEGLQTLLLGGATAVSTLMALNVLPSFDNDSLEVKIETSAAALASGTVTAIRLYEHSQAIRFWRAAPYGVSNIHHKVCELVTPANVDSDTAAVPRLTIS